MIHELFTIEWDSQGWTHWTSQGPESPKDQPPTMSEWVWGRLGTEVGKRLRDLTQHCVKLRGGGVKVHLKEGWYIYLFVGTGRWAEIKVRRPTVLGRVPRTVLVSYPGRRHQTLMGFRILWKGLLPWTKVNYGRNKNSLTLINKGKNQIFFGCGGRRPGTTVGPSTVPVSDKIVVRRVSVFDSVQWVSTWYVKVYRHPDNTTYVTSYEFCVHSHKL